MSKSIFDFTKLDLEQPIFKLYIKDYVDFTYKNVVVTKYLLDKCEIIEYKYYEKWKQNIDDNKVKLYGFQSLEDFKETYIRCMIYNSIKFFREQFTLLDDFEWKHKKAMKFRNKDTEKYVNPVEESKCRNVLDYYMKFSMNMLFNIGFRIDVHNIYNILK